MIKLLIFALTVLGTCARTSYFDPHHMDVNMTDTSDMDLDLGHNRSHYSFSYNVLNSLTVGPQNINFLEKVHINKLTLGDESHVYIHNKSSFGRIDISKNSYLNLHDCEITSSAININGTLETSGYVSIIDSTIIFGPGSSLINNGTIVLDNSTFIIDTSILLTDETSIISSGDSSIIVYGTIEIYGAVNISTPIILNNIANMIVNSNSTVILNDISLLGYIQVLTLSTLLINGNFIIDNILSARRKLLQLNSDPSGSCIFNNAVLSGAGILDCNIVFTSTISLSIGSEHEYVSFSSQDDITIGGELQIEFKFIPTKSLNFTILYTQYGTISGTFSSVIFSGPDQTILYTDNAVIIKVIPQLILQIVPQPPHSSSIVIAVSTISLFCLVVGLIYMRRRNIQKQQLKKQQELIFISTDEYSSCINPLV